MLSHPNYLETEQKKTTTTTAQIKCYANDGREGPRPRAGEWVLFIQHLFASTRKVRLCKLIMQYQLKVQANEVRWATSSFLNHTIYIRKMWEKERGRKSEWERERKPCRFNSNDFRYFNSKIGECRNIFYIMRPFCRPNGRRIECKI